MYKLKLDRYRRHKLELDRYITLREEEHNQEVYRLERKLEEYLGLTSEKDIRVEEEYLRLCRRLKLVYVERWSSEDDKELDAMRDWDWYDLPGSDPDDYPKGLDTSTYVSPPSSLRCSKGYMGTWGVCKVSNVLVLNVGRIVGWTRTTIFGFKFRVPRPPGTQDSTLRYNGYYVTVNMTTSRKYFGWGSSNHIVNALLTDTDKSYLPLGSWHQYRVTWWKVGSVLYIRFQSRKNEDWHTLISSSDSNNRYDTETYQRPGIYGNSDWHDDTEIWAL